jgi:hypothetical protein
MAIGNEAGGAFLQLGLRSPALYFVDDMMLAVRLAHAANAAVDRCEV